MKSPDKLMHLPFTQGSLLHKSTFAIRILAGMAQIAIGWQYPFPEHAFGISEHGLNDV